MILEPEKTGMILKIKNMVSSRCKAFVQNEMNNMGVYNLTVALGEVELSENLPEEKLRLLDIALRSAGLELLENRKQHLVEKIKAAIYELVYHTDDIYKPNLSDFISQKVNLSYASLSNTFLNIQGKTIEKYNIPSLFFFRLICKFRTIKTNY